LKQDRLRIGIKSRHPILGSIKDWGLALALVFGFLLRFWNLDLKPLWLDETITLLFSLGHRYDDIPRETLLPLGDLLAGLAWQPQSCRAIAQSISTQSTHPPLFFCGMHQWMGMLRDSGLSLRWQVRSLPALFGVAEIAAMYGLNRAAFSHRAGIWAAGAMAVSPFAVYLSQEARHYTLPMLAITLSMIPVVQIARYISSKQPSSLWLWLAWAALSSLGFYIHYFCLLAFVAQVAALLALIAHFRQWRQLTWIGSAIALVGLSLLPWLPFLLSHSQRSETDWLRFEGGGFLDWLGPIARLLAGGIITVVMLPVEEQSLAITIADGLGMLAIAAYLSRLLWTQIPSLLRKPQTHVGTVVLGFVLLAILAEYVLLVYGFRKDLTLAPRYAFVFYPMLCALISAALAEPSRKRFQPLNLQLLPWILILVGLTSTGFVVNDLAFLKPFQPKQVAQQFLKTSDPALVVLQTYRGTQDVALGLSLALAVQQFSEQPGTAQTIPQTIQWAFADAQGQNDLAGRSPLPSPATLWRIGTTDRQKTEAVASLKISIPESTQKEGLACTAQRPALLAIGAQYQHFRCEISNPLLKD
jgi:uncharacterized membrane protein